MEIVRHCGILEKKNTKNSDYVLKVGSEKFEIKHRNGPDALAGLDGAKITCEGTLHNGVLTIYTYAKHCI